AATRRRVDDVVVLLPAHRPPTYGRARGRKPTSVEVDGLAGRVAARGVVVGDAHRPPARTGGTGRAHVATEAHEDGALELERDPRRGTVGRPGLGRRAEVELHARRDAQGTGAPVDRDRLPAGNAARPHDGARPVRRELVEGAVVAEDLQRAPDRGIDTAVRHARGAQGDLHRAEQHRPDDDGLAGRAVDRAELGVVTEAAARAVERADLVREDLARDGEVAAVDDDGRGRPERPEARRLRPLLHDAPECVTGCREDEETPLLDESPLSDEDDDEDDELRLLLLLLLPLLDDTEPDDVEPFDVFDVVV